ncbi:MAG: hypothetical protein JW993_19475 [Sedimentisphaerales bacterium]|nr:hypothetical protein [Sedimentisphaerales bacterium]
MAARSVKRKVTVWGILVVLFAGLMLSGCGKNNEPAPQPDNEPNAAMSTPADANN